MKRWSRAFPRKPRLHAYHPLGHSRMDSGAFWFSQPLLFFLQQPINLPYKFHEFFRVSLHSCLLAKLLPARVIFHRELFSTWLFGSPYGRCKTKAFCNPTSVPTRKLAARRRFSQRHVLKSCAADCDCLVRRQAPPAGKNRQRVPVDHAAACMFTVPAICVRSSSAFSSSASMPSRMEASDDRPIISAQRRKVP